MSKTKLCKNCKRQVDKSMKICPYCGTRLKMGIVKKTFLAIFVVFAVLMIIGINSPDNSNTTNSNQKSASSKTTNSSSDEKKSKSTTNKVDSSNSYEFSFDKEESEFSSKFIKNFYNRKPNYVKLKSKLFSSDYYKITSDKSDYIYFGDLKDSIPNGKGVLLEKVSSGDITSLFAPIYIGYFKNGNFNGFGFKFEQVSDDKIVQNIYKAYDDQFRTIGVVYRNYEGYFEDGKFSGKGNLYQIDFGDSPNNLQSAVTDNSMNNTFEKYLKDNDNEIQKLKDKYRNQDSEFLISSLKPVNSLIQYSGNFSKDEYDGKGKLYYENGKLKYNGDFSKGKYNGTGVLYDKDGSVKYSGKWSNGDSK